MHIYEPPCSYKPPATKRFRILVVENTGNEFELCCVDNDPDAIVKALREKRLCGGEIKIRQYVSVRAVDITAETAP